MGKSTTPKYVVEMSGMTASAWHVKARYGIPGNGLPTNANLAKYVQAYIDSLKIGGANQHISVTLGYVPVPNWARIKENCAGGAVLAEWKAPMFMEI